MDASILEAALWAVSQKVNRQLVAFRGGLFGVFTGQFRSTLFGVLHESIELM